jgi:hypothetical protein
MMKRVLWGVLVATTLVVAGMVARQVSATLWRKTMHEEPPTERV